MIMKVSSKFGTVIAEELKTVDIYPKEVDTDVQPLADEKTKTIPTVTAADQEESEAASDSC